MSIAATVRALVNAGCTPEQIAAAVDAWEQGELTKAAARREKDAARKRAERLRVQNVTRSHADISDSPSPSSPSSSSPPITPLITTPLSIPSLLVSSEPSVSDPSDAKPKRIKASYPDEFEAFWRTYPTDRLMSKLEAVRAWNRLSQEDRAAASSAVPAFRAHCAKDPTYRPIHACRFLSQRRFDGFASATGPPAEPQFASVREYAEWRDRQHAEGKLQ